MIIGRADFNHILRRQRIENIYQKALHDVATWLGQCMDPISTSNGNVWYRISLRIPLRPYEQQSLLNLLIKVNLWDSVPTVG